MARKIVQGAATRPSQFHQDTLRLFVVLQATIDQQEEHRHEEDRQDRGGDHAADHAGADVVLAGGARAARERQRETPAMKAMEVIRMGRSRSRAASSAASQRLQASLLMLHRELHDQDRVLGGQADGGEQADLEINVVEQPAQRSRRRWRRSRPGE